MSPIIENINGFDLPPGTEPILQKMFANHSRVVIKDEFSGGLGGSRVIVVRPIRADGTAELPVVVKLAAVSLNEKEWRAYQDCVHSQLPHAAQAKGPPVTLPGSNWSGLCYPLLGGGGTFKVDRLRDYVQRRMVMADDARFALKRLLTAIGRILQFGQPHPEFRLRASYDRILPLNLLIRPTPLPPDAKPITIRPGALPRRSLQKGDPVRVEGFAIAKVDLIDRTITLNLPAGDWPDAYYLRLKPIEAAKPYQVKQIMDPVEGVVSQTRSQWLRNKVASILDEDIDLTGQTLPLPDGTSLPNPLATWPDLLCQCRDVRVSCIHGDLNLENILVDRETREVSLIDFSEARRDHVLHDFLRLETEVMTKIIPAILHRHALPPARTLVPFCRQLHCAAFQATPVRPALPHPGLEKPFAMLTTIRQTARKYLFNSDDPGEYYLGLTLYLLGALKFENLDRAPTHPLPKQVAFWGAALACRFLTDPPALCREPLPLALIIGAWPQVEVKRAGTDTIQEASFGTPLYRGDVVNTDTRAAASIVCQNGLLFNVPERSRFVVDCLKKDDPWLVGRLGPIVPDPTLSLAEAFGLPQDRFTVRAADSRAEQAQKPLLLSPRNTGVADPCPTFRWQPVLGATGYHLRLTMPGGQSWSRETADTTLPYPDDAPPLAPGSANTVSLTAFGPSVYGGDTTLLRMLTEPRLAELAEAKVAIRSLAIDEAAQRYLLAQFYQEQELYADAIAQLEHLAAEQDASSPHLSQKLGDLCLEIELYTQAEAHYQEALKIAQDSVDPSAQASAHTGLGHVSAAFGEIDQALQHLATAEILHRDAE